MAAGKPIAVSVRILMEWERSTVTVAWAIAGRAGTIAVRSARQQRRKRYPEPGRFR
jgi:hypothetical protein